MTFKFPDNFYWGTASAAHQVEGNNHNDFSVWESQHADWLVAEAKKPTSQWQDWQRQRFPEMFARGNYISGRACDFYHRFKEDFDLAKNMHNNSYRLSFEWSRVEPVPGKFDEQEIAHYQQVINALKTRGLEPFVGLWHSTSPVWLYDKAGQGGWDNPKVVDYFEKFAQKMVEEFPNIKYWTILNEPDIYAAGMYLTNFFPPRGFNPAKFLILINRFINCHKQVYQTMKRTNPKIQIGIAKSYWYFEPRPQTFLNHEMANLANYLWNHFLLDKLSTYLDFIGLNVYDWIQIGKKTGRAQAKIVNDVGLPINPETMYYTTMDAWKRYHKPIFITENGVSDSEDRIRPWFIKENLKNLASAIKDGADVRGYFHWSLTDNFEWNKGFWPRLGLVAIDYKTLKRSPRPSAGVYSKICQANKITI